MTKRVEKIVRMLLEDQTNQSQNFYSENLSRRERRDISKAFNQTMWDEIGMLRMLIKRFFDASAKRTDQNDLVACANDLKLFGLSCTRLARVMQANLALETNARGSIDDSVNAALEAVLADLSQQASTDLPGVNNG